jgi:antagonist of KipI
MDTKVLTLVFQKPGMHTLIQDMGRPGHQSSGIPSGGALDKTAARAANMCVGNPESTPVLEITMMGPQIVFDADCQIAITGADMSPTLDEDPIDQYTTINVESGSTLAFGKLRSGCRSYLAVRGEWQVTSWLGSASALSVRDVHLVAGSVIQKGARIKILAKEPLSEAVRHPEPIREWSDTFHVRVLAGPEFQSFSAQQIAFFFSEEFTIGKESNRMGYRLEPSLPGYEPKTEMISSGIVTGTIQVTRQGQPVILLADAQTTGGYPRIANVLSADLDALAQLKPGDNVRFHIVKA